jgi:glutamyl-tRNA synthetase
MNTPYYDLDALIPKNLSAAQTRQLLAQVRTFLKSLPVRQFDRHTLDRGLRDLAVAQGIEPAHLFRILRVAIRGPLASPDLFEVMTTLGKERVLERVDAALHKLTDVA